MPTTAGTSFPNGQPWRATDPELPENVAVVHQKMLHDCARQSDVRVGPTGQLAPADGRLDAIKQQRLSTGHDLCRFRQRAVEQQSGYTRP